VRDRTIEQESFPISGDLRDQRQLLIRNNPVLKWLYSGHDPTLGIFYSCEFCGSSFQYFSLFELAVSIPFPERPTRAFVF
jgi:hypothetical protein